MRLLSEQKNCFIRALSISEEAVLQGACCWSRGYEVAEHWNWSPSLWKALAWIDGSADREGDWVMKFDSIVDGESVRSRHDQLGSQRQLEKFVKGWSDAVEEEEFAASRITVQLYDYVDAISQQESMNVSSFLGRDEFVLFGSSSTSATKNILRTSEEHPMMSTSEISVLCWWLEKTLNQICFVLRARTTPTVKANSICKRWNVEKNIPFFYDYLSVVEQKKWRSTYHDYRHRFDIMNK